MCINITSLVVTKPFDRYIRDQADRKLRRCKERILELEDAITRSSEDIVHMREEAEKLAQEVSSANSTLSTLNNNLLARKYKREMVEVDQEIAALDLEQASQAHQQFNEKYIKAKAAEEEATRQVSTFSNTGILSLTRIIGSLNIFKEN
jgi:chromosome segregation ATPase